ncbi:hypothetical protein [Neisseria subflava]|uniref:hypothetical protein n=1 Tax=Neisseria subflava TaxID=28449 RepID=UPI000D31EACA|nr:hypothetical protein [Neisseria subflava]
MAANTESTKKEITAYLIKNSLKYQYDEEVNGFILGFSVKVQQDMKFKLAISIQEGGDFIQFFSLLKLKPNVPDFQQRLLKENLEKKLIKWSADEEKNVVCSVDILIDYKEEISHNQIERALQIIQSSIVALSDLFSFE